MHRKAIIDLGTNTFHLLVAEWKDGEYIPVFRKQIAVKLGEGGINEGQIAPAPFKRGLDALRDYKQELDQLGVSNIKAYATSAIRSASNGDEFIRQAQELTSIKITKIDGEREAELIFEGVKHAIPLSDEKVLVMDIGGGSVEFIIGNREHVFWVKSFTIGAARLIELYHKHEPILREDVQALESFLEKELQPLIEAVSEHKVSKLLGSAGSFESVVELIEEQLGKHLMKADETWCKIPVRDYEKIHSLLLGSTLEERKRMRGMADYRVEMMVVATIMIHFVLKRLNISSLFCSSYSLKEGILFGVH